MWTKPNQVCSVYEFCVRGSDTNTRPIWWACKGRNISLDVCQHKVTSERKMKPNAYAMYTVCTVAFEVGFDNFWVFRFSCWFNQLHLNFESFSNGEWMRHIKKSVISGFRLHIQYIEHITDYYWLPSSTTIDDNICFLVCFFSLTFHFQHLEFNTNHMVSSSC